MSLRRALFIAAVLLPAAAGPAVAEPAATQAAPAMQQAPPCIRDFVRLRDDAAKKAQAIRAANEHKVDVKTACHLFIVFSKAEAKLIKYADANATWCGIPPQVVKTMKREHAKTNAIRTRVCQVAATPPRPPGPTLSESLGAPIPDANNIKTGRGGTFDTLTGAPIGTR